MKRIILSAIILACASLSTAAQTRTAYFMEGTTYRSHFNPAFAPTRGYFNIPVAGGINFNIDGTLSISDLLKKNPNGPGLVTVLSSSIPYDEAVAGLNRGSNSFNFNTNINIIGFGAYTSNRRNFWSADVNFRAEAALDIPFSFFDFAKNISNGSNNYDLSGMQAVINSYIDIGFNYSFPVTKGLYVGARAKLLVGLAHANAQINNFNIDLGDEQWSGSAQALMNIYMNGLTADDTLNNMTMKFKGPSGYGFGVDLGVSYNLLENLQLSVAVNDIGFISWSRAGAMSFETDRQGIEFSGADIVIDGNGATTSDTKFSFDNFNLHKTGNAQSGATTLLRATVNAGVKYDVWRHRIGFGLLYNARMGLYKPSHNITASVNFSPCRWFTLTPSYTFNNNAGGAVGLALNLCPGFINLFVATDMLLSKLTPQYIPYNQDRMTFTFGLGVPIGKRGCRQQY